MGVRDSLFDSEIQNLEFMSLLDKDNPFDNLIIKLAINGKLKIGIVKVRCEKRHFYDKIIPNFLFYRQKNPF